MMKIEQSPSSRKADRAKRRFWFLVLPALGLVGLFFTGLQIFPRWMASYWKQQLADAPVNRVEIILDRIAELDEGGTAVLVEALGSEREGVALGAKRRLLDRLEQWKSLSEDEYASRLLTLAELLAAQTKAFGPAAQRDAADLATQLLLCPSKDESRGSSVQLIAACDEVFQAAKSVHGKSYPPPQLFGNSSRQFNGDPDASRSVARQRWESQKMAAPHFDPLPGGGLPLGSPPAEEQKSDHVLPGDNGEMPPAYFQEPSDSRSLDFSNRAGNPLHVSDAAKPQNTGGGSVPGQDREIESVSRVEPLGGANSAALDLRAWETLDLMRQLGSAEEKPAEKFQAELRRRGFSAVEIDLARRLFDADPAVRKRLIAELPAMPDIDASAWLTQCCKDEDAEVRLAAFSLLATSNNPLLLQKIKVLRRTTPTPASSASRIEFTTSGTSSIIQHFFATCPSLRRIGTIIPHTTTWLSARKPLRRPTSSRRPAASIALSRCGDCSNRLAARAA